MAIVTTNDKHYGDIADAIRTMADIETTFLPSEMAAGILAIPSGGGGDIDALIDRSITTISSNAETIADCALYLYAGLTSASFPFAESIGVQAFNGCSALESISVPLVTTIGDQAFKGCRALESISVPLVTTIRSGGFMSCRALEAVAFPLLSALTADVFRSCSKLASADFSIASSINVTVFQDCSSLVTLILRSPTVCTLSRTNAFTSTPIAAGTGYIYVPSTLVASYQAASNWTTFASQIRAIEDYPEITGG